MPGLFQEVDGETCILISGGTYIECAVYSRNHGELFAKLGRGFVRLYANGATSQSKARLDTLTVYPLYKDSLGKLYLRPVATKTVLVADNHPFRPIDTGAN